MKKLQQVQQELAGYNKAVADMQKDRTEKLQEIQKQDKERKKIIMSSFGGQVDGRKTKPFNQAIEQLEKEIEAIDEQLELAEQVKTEKFTPMIQELKKERSDLINKNNNKVSQIEKGLFEQKLKFMKAIEEAGQEQRDLQQEVNELTEVVRQFERVSDEVLKQFTVHNPNYLIYGTTATPPVTITDSEAHKFVHGGNSPHRLPYSFLVYKVSGEVIIDEVEAHDRYNKLMKGAKK